MSIHIIQDGVDGFGHQLDGLFTCLILHNVNNYYFDGISFIEKKFSFEHTNKEEGILLKEYLIESVNIFIKEYNLDKIKYTNTVRSHELWNIPDNYCSTILYSLDNIFFFKRIFKNNIEALEKINKNISHMKSYFINEKLPINRLNKKNIVIHIRLGDAITTGRGNTIYPYNKKILLLIEVFKIKYPDYHYYIHSDGEPTEIIQKIGNNYTFYNKNTPILEVLSDFIHSNILVCGNSSLSIISSYFGNKELVITHDECDRSIPDNNVYSISNYISL